MEKPFDVTYGMLAPRNKRLANTIIDGLIVYIITVIAVQGVNVVEGNNALVTPEEWVPVLNSFGFAIYNYVVSLLYYGLFESLTFRTVGKYITNTKVILRDGTQPDSITILLRTICRFIPLEFISFLISPIGWHDSLSKTLVVDIYRYKTAMRQKDEVNDIGTDNIN